MDYAVSLRQRHRGLLEALRTQERSPERDRGKHREEAQTDRARRLLAEVQKGAAGRFAQDVAAAYLYQELVSVDDASALAFRGRWQEAVLQTQEKDVYSEDIQAWKLGGIVRACERPSFDLRVLPAGAWLLQFTLTLAKPHISRDEEPLHLTDNPVTKDHTFGLPLIRPSSWKGNLRSVLRLTKGLDDQDPAIVRLFGNPKGAEADVRAGRLASYPTFFRRIGLEIINPHDRSRRVGRNPILIECVPAGAQGTFSLLYVPLDLIGRVEDQVHRQAGEDMQLVAEAVRAMMLVYGFSAKRSSGYGTAEDRIAHGALRTRAGEWPLSSLRQLPQEVQHARL